jgi:hypothetical protein
VFSGAMANPVTRYATEIEVIADAAFTVLEFQFDGGETEQVGPATIASYPALFKLEAVKSFKLASDTASKLQRCNCSNRLQRCLMNAQSSGLSDK